MWELRPKWLPQRQDLIRGGKPSIVFVSGFILQNAHRLEYYCTTECFTLLLAPSAGLSAHFCPCRSWMLSFIFAAAFGTRVLSSNIEPVFCQDMQINYMQISEQCGSCTNFLSLCESLRPIPRFAASKTTTVRYQNGSCLSHFLNLYDLTKRSHE